MVAVVGYDAFVFYDAFDMLPIGSDDGQVIGYGVVIGPPTAHIVGGVAMRGFDVDGERSHTMDVIAHAYRDVRPVSFLRFRVTAPILEFGEAIRVPILFDDGVDGCLQVVGIH